MRDIFISNTFSVDGKVMNSHLAAIRHARWFEENASHSRYQMEKLFHLMKLCSNNTSIFASSQFHEQVIFCSSPMRHAFIICKKFLAFRKYLQSFSALKVELNSVENMTLSRMES